MRAGAVTERQQANGARVLRPRPVHAEQNTRLLWKLRLQGVQAAQESVSHCWR